MDRIELKVPPLLLVVVAALLMGGLARVGEPFGYEFPYRWILAALAAIAGAGVIAAALISFRIARTTVDPRYPENSSALVIAGIYRYSRNPMYLGFVLLLMAWALFLANGLSILLVIAFITYLNRFQILPEERHLARRFGAEFEAYRNQVRRWL